MAGFSGHASGSAVIGVTVAMTVLAGLVVFTRLFTRIWIVQEPGLDDGFILAALLFSIATTVTMCLQVRWGMGQHISTLAPDEIVENLKAFYISIWVYNLSMSCTKFSILLQYLRIFPQRMFRVACYILMVLVGIYACWTFFSAVFACWPIATFWNAVAHPGGRCLDLFAVWFANAGMNIATDIAIGILPLRVLKDLQLPRRQRIALMIVFGLGGFACIVSIFRLDSLYVISKSKDPTWQNPLAAIWSSVEINTGILCSCLPTLRGLLNRAFPGIFASSSRASYEPKQNEHETSDSNPSTDDPDQSQKHPVRKSLEALGRSIAAIGESRLKSSCTDTSSDEIICDDGERLSYVEHGQIQVVTTLEQDIEESGESKRFGEKDMYLY